MTEYKLQIVWRNVILMSLVHLGALYGIKLIITDSQFKTLFFSLLYGFISSFGIQVGSHRLWSHRAFKAKLPLQLILAACQTMGLQNDIYDWSRDHRVHHKYVDTDADPHNSERGFFFSHVGWLLCKKHPDIKEKGKTIDMSDLDKDALVQFQRRFYFPLVFIFWGAVPTLIPWYFWGEKLSSSILICVLFRYAMTLNLTWLVNSAAHMWGTKPYDKGIHPVECVLKDMLGGEGFHNYHHTFPKDYSASEFGPSHVLNPMTSLIDMFAKIGWAYDFKKVSSKIVEEKMDRLGDNSVAKPLSFYNYALAIFTYVSHIIFLAALKFLYNSYISGRMNMVI